jgi:hypothetical protein
MAGDAPTSRRYPGRPCSRPGLVETSAQCAAHGLGMIRDPVADMKINCWK